jgi:hypothetical protein
MKTIKIKLGFIRRLALLFRGTMTLNFSQDIISFRKNNSDGSFNIYLGDINNNLTK